MKYPILKPSKVWLYTTAPCVINLWLTGNRLWLDQCTLDWISPVQSWFSRLTPNHDQSLMGKTAKEGGGVVLTKADTQWSLRAGWMTIGVVSPHLLTFRGQRSQERVRKWGKEWHRAKGGGSLKKRDNRWIKDGLKWMRIRRRPGWCASFVSWLWSQQIPPQRGQMLEPWERMRSNYKPRDRRPATTVGGTPDSGAVKDPTGKQVPAKGSILSTSVHHRLSPIVGVQRYILQLENAWRVTQNTQAEPPMPQRSHHDEFFLPVEQTWLITSSVNYRMPLSMAAIAVLATCVAGNAT